MEVSVALWLLNANAHQLLPASAQEDVKTQAQTVV